ncbi:SPOR domain-containing protein [Uliginosibacterium sp. sgz301328]|uniref:SPOR domain-containing protein n=1 Tax=Uliginosibacterium sp. sgz301328 TaxID=3243764 RepID=UPI00359EB643
MAEQAGENTEDPGRLKRQLVARGVVAAALIVALLAVLLLVERNQRPEPPATARTVTQIGPSFSDGQSGAIAALAAETSQAIGSAPIVVQGPVAEPEPEETAPPTPVARTDSASSKPDVTIAPPSSAAPRAASAAASAAVIEQRPATNVTRDERMPAAAPAGTYIVQLGVFSSAANADQLVRRLKQKGISARVETRVELGPFKNREEAVAAQTQLRRAGFDAGMLVLPKK